MKTKVASTMIRDKRHERRGSDDGDLMNKSAKIGR
jgi:hypothetical protein